MIADPEDTHAVYERQAKAYDDQRSRERWPNADWRQADGRTFELDQLFDGIIAWNNFSHLTADQQKEGIARMARHGGMLLQTVGPNAGVEHGTVGTESVYHASLSPTGYPVCLDKVVCV
ncbi:trans-aconitate 2-methyltransferase [Ruegeria sp. HKCCA5491]|uniref:class I SAM-dependent methyltransferase n=1 Tax=Ruegeria sp. HKCCA5491 TaxID=2682986 RepID=UPI0014882D21|nr:class I SAM-dependent methyltransferase [Ruegeria sp. HKCCA5491]